MAVYASDRSSYAIRSWIKLELELAVLYLRPVLVGRRGIDVSTPEQEGHLHSLILYAGVGLPDVDGQLSQLADMVLVYELNVGLVGHVENDSHYRLSHPYWAVYFSVNLVDAHWLTFPYKCIEDIFTELLALNYYPFFLRMNFRVKHGESVDSISAFGYSGRNRARIVTIQAGSSNNWYLGSAGNQYLDFVVLELLEDFSLEIRRLWKPSHEEDEIELFAFWLDLTDELLDFVFNILKQGLEEGSHKTGRKFQVGSSSEFEMKLGSMLVIVILYEFLELFGVEILAQVTELYHWPLVLLAFELPLDDLEIL